jgi:hypothetical protein
MPGKEGNQWTTTMPAQCEQRSHHGKGNGASAVLFDRYHATKKTEETILLPHTSCKQRGRQRNKRQARRAAGRQQRRQHDMSNVAIATRATMPARCHLTHTVLPKKTE